MKPFFTEDDLVEIPNRGDRVAALKDINAKAAPLLDLLREVREKFGTHSDIRHKINSVLGIEETKTLPPDFPYGDSYE